MAIQPVRQQQQPQNNTGSSRSNNSVSGGQQQNTPPPPKKNDEPKGNIQSKSATSGSTINHRNSRSSTSSNSTVQKPSLPNNPRINGATRHDQFHYQGNGGTFKQPSNPGGDMPDGNNLITQLKPQSHHAGQHNPFQQQSQSLQGQRQATKSEPVSPASQKAQAKQGEPAGFKPAGDSGKSTATSSRKGEGDKPDNKPDAPKPNSAFNFEQAVKDKDWQGVRNHFKEAIQNGRFDVGQFQKAFHAGADLQDLDLRNLPEGALNDKTFEGGSLNMAKFPSISGTTFKNTSMFLGDFKGKTLENVTFDNVNGRRAHFEGATLKNTTFNGGDFAGADFGDRINRFDSKPATLDHVTFNTEMQGDYSITEGRHPLTGEKSKMTLIGSTANFDNAKLNQVQFNNTKPMGHSSFNGATLNNVQFNGPALWNTNFQNATLNNVTMPKEIYGSRVGFDDATIQNSRFTGSDLRGVNFTNANIDAATDFKGARYTGGEYFPKGFDPQTRGMVKGGFEGLQEKMGETALGTLKARTGNDVEGLRKQIGELGKEIGKPLDGQGRKIGHVEPFNDNSTPGEQPYLTEHSKNVEDRINSPDRFGGLAPKAQTERFDVNPDTQSFYNPFQKPDGSERTPADTEAQFKEIVDQVATGLYQHVSPILKGIADRQEKLSPGDRLDAVNMSIGWNKLETYNIMQEFLDTRTHTGYAYPNMRRSVYGDNGDALPRHEQRQKLVDYVHNHLNPETNKAFREARQEYQKQTERLWKQGTPVVVSAGNERDNLTDPKPRSAPADWKPTNYPKHSDTNFMSMGKVLSIGATHHNNTSETIKDDKLADFSSHGDGKYNPTVTAPGASVAVRDTVQDGTSFAAPYVSGLISLMRQVNPNLTSDQVRDILTSTAHDNPAIPEIAEGAGQVDVMAALRKAWQLHK